jgi:RNase adaptor protein for sRNA GlmZ degradation
MATARRPDDPDLPALQPAATAPDSNAEQHVVILSGLSGGGKTAAAKLFEDLGYTVVDNLPGELLAELAELVSDEPERFGTVAIVLDVRFMQNPYYIAELRQLSGLTEAVREYVLGQPVAQEFLRYLHEFLAFALPAYVGEGKTRLTIALGCTGGYHRSIALAEALAGWLREQDFGPVAVFHRELERA